MSVLKKHITIAKDVATANDLDYHFLRKNGIEYIQQLGGALWTDYNVHDPGITILEMLCYAITDLGNRIDMPIENLLTSEDPVKNINKQFYKASEILPSKPVTTLDYRKLFIDIEGVKNCWLQKFKKTIYIDCKNDLLSYNPEQFKNVPSSKKKNFDLKGLYDIYVDFESEVPDDITKVAEDIRKKYHDNRNLCEDLIHIKKVEIHPISVCANIDLDITADEEWVHAQVLFRIKDYFSTNIHFYSLKEMLDAGLKTTEIFEGPVLKNGFIKTNELIKAELRSEVRLSDIINIVMGIPGVKVIKDIQIGNCDVENNSESIICVAANTKPFLCDKSVFNYNKDVIPLTINPERLAYNLELLIAQASDEKEDASKNKELNLPQGVYSRSGDYTTIQNDFPDTYGISEIGIPGNPTIQRKSQAKQLKAYLLFFDQILASYFKHLEKINEVLAFNGEVTKTFFTQSVKDIVGLTDLVDDYPTSDDDLLTTTLFDRLDNNIERRNQILDHLIARFAERFTDYSFIMKSIYGSSASEIVLRNKEDFLKDYSALSTSRGSAFNYYHQEKSQIWDTDNISGAQQRISRLLGITNYNRRNLTNSFVEIYALINADNCKVYRWRIRNASNQIILSATDEYHDNFLATRELYFAVLQIIQTNAYEVENVLKTDFDHTVTIGNILIHESESKKYSFDIINPAIEDHDHKDYIVAKRWTYFDSKEDIIKVILELIDFMKYEFTEEGLFLVEHILLRPDVSKPDDVPSENFMPICTDECTDCEPLDPYSFRVSVVIPGYTFRFYNTDFRNYMENIIRQELPAHVMSKICWVGFRKGEVADDENDLLIFEKRYKKYLYEKTSLEQEQPQLELSNVITSISSMHNVYPSGRLYDCDDEVEELSGKVILGKTNLGSL